ncbi:hypothetical protein HK097_002918, partial [Rhizophlyctis rosea]
MTIPILKRRKFSPAEDKMIIKQARWAARGGDKPAWGMLARQLGRNYDSVWSRWNSLNAAIREGTFTEAEDNFISEEVSAGNGGPDNWAGIARQLHRTSDSVRKRWNRKLSESQKKGKWTKEEDEAIVQEGLSAARERR